MPSSRLIIDALALRQNFEDLGSTLDRKIMPMVKGGGYGLGSLEMANLFGEFGVPFVGVSHQQEAIDLRLGGYRRPIFVLSSPDPKLILDYGLTPAISSLRELHALDREAEEKEQPVAIHLQIDNCLNRFGFRNKEAFEALPFIHKSRWLSLDGVMSHLGSNLDEVAHFEAFVRAAPSNWIHIESTKSLDLQLPYCNMVRVGLQLIRGVTLKSSIVAFRDYYHGETIGYDPERLKRDRRLAILSIGYHDGLALQSARKGYVMIHGKRAPYIGTLYMDFLVCDITGIDAKIGDEAEIFGGQIPIEEVAKWSQTNPRQLLCCLGPRVEREYVNVRQALETGKTHCTATGNLASHRVGSGDLHAERRCCEPG